MSSSAGSAANVSGGVEAPFSVLQFARRHPVMTAVVGVVVLVVYLTLNILGTMAMNELNEDAEELPVLANTAVCVAGWAINPFLSIPLLVANKRRRETASS